MRDAALVRGVAFVQRISGILNSFRYARTVAKRVSAAVQKWNNC